MKKKKILLIILLLLFIGVISSQIFFIYTRKGNLELLVCNEKLSTNLTHIEIYIDGEKVIEDTFDTYYSNYSVKTALSNHSLIIKINGYESEEIRFNTILFTSIYIDYHVDELNQNKPRICFGIKKIPIYFLS